MVDGLRCGAPSARTECVGDAEGGMIFELSKCALVTVRVDAKFVEPEGGLDAISRVIVIDTPNLLRRAM